MFDLKGNRITYFGHSTFSVTTPSGQVALIDPWVMTNPRCPESLKKLDRLDAIFLTHAHSDHLADLVALAKKFRPKLVANFETGLWLLSKGFQEQVSPMNKGGWQLVGDFRVNMTHAMHSNSIEDDGKVVYGGEPAGYIVALPGGVTLYHAGDTALFGDMKLIGELYQPVIAMLHGDSTPWDRAKRLRIGFWASNTSFPCITRRFPRSPALRRPSAAKRKMFPASPCALKPGESSHRPHPQHWLAFSDTPRRRALRTSRNVLLLLQLRAGNQ
jgi:glyoxylase-like metal-dependent hydrolase (beta-lactamase superfamily II)